MSKAVPKNLFMCPYCLKESDNFWTVLQCSRNCKKKFIEELNEINRRKELIVKRRLVL